MNGGGREINMESLYLLGVRHKIERLLEAEGFALVGAGTDLTNGKMDISARVNAHEKLFIELEVKPAGGGC